MDHPNLAECILPFLQFPCLQEHLQQKIEELCCRRRRFMHSEFSTCMTVSSRLLYFRLLSPCGFVWMHRLVHCATDSTCVKELMRFIKKHQVPQANQ